MLLLLKNSLLTFPPTNISNPPFSINTQTPAKQGATLYLQCSQNRPSINYYPASIYLLKVNNRNTRTRCEICSKLTIKTPERR